MNEDLKKRDPLIYNLIRDTLIGSTEVIGVKKLFSPINSPISISKDKKITKKITRADVIEFNNDNNVRDD